MHDIRYLKIHQNYCTMFSSAAYTHVAVHSAFLVAVGYKAPGGVSQSENEALRCLGCQDERVQITFKCFYSNKVIRFLFCSLRQTLKKASTLSHCS